VPTAEHAEVARVEPDRGELRAERRLDHRLGEQRQRVKRELGERRRPGLGQNAAVGRAAAAVNASAASKVLLDKMTSPRPVVVSL
jgi:hypothetical protein